MVNGYPHQVKKALLVSTLNSRVGRCLLCFPIYYFIPERVARWESMRIRLDHFENNFK